MPQDGHRSVGVRLPITTYDRLTKVAEERGFAPGVLARRLIERGLIDLQNQGSDPLAPKPIPDA